MMQASPCSMLVPSHTDAVSHLLPLFELSHLCCIFFEAEAAQPHELDVPWIRRWHCRVRCCVGCSFPNKSESISAGFGTAEPGVFMALSPLRSSISVTHGDYVCVVGAGFIYIYDSVFSDHELTPAFYRPIVQNCEIIPQLFTSSFRSDCPRGLVTIDPQEIWGVC